MPRSSPLPLLLAAVVLSLTACGGSGSGTPAAPPPVQAVPATALTYVDPPAGGWRLVQNPSSTPTRIVLDLVGPAGQVTRGVGFNLKAPAGVKFGAFDGGLPIRDTGVYELRSAAADPGEPVALVGGVKPGNVLSVGIYQKDRTHPAKDSGSALCQIALELDASAPPAKASSLVLSVPKARVIPEDIGSTTDETWLLDRKMQMGVVAIAVGTLTAN